MSGKPGSKAGVFRYYTITCVGCGKSFKHRRKPKYCSTQCYHKHKYKHPVPGKPLTAKRLHEMLNYNSKTGKFTWLIWHGRIPANTIAGTIGKHNHRVITVDHKKYMASRLAYLWMKGRWPPFEIDHINCNPIDDRWRNLRSATRSQNIANTRVRKNKQIPSKGVSINTSNPTRYFAHGVGYFATLKEAHTAYIKAAKKRYGKFARAK